MPSRVPPEDPAGLCPSLLFPSLFPLSTQPKSLSMLCCHFNFSLFLFPFVSYFSFYHLVFTCFPTAPLRCRDRPQLTSLFFFLLLLDLGRNQTKQSALAKVAMSHCMQPSSPLPIPTSSSPDHEEAPPLSASYPPINGELPPAALPPVPQITAPSLNDISATLHSHQFDHVDASDTPPNLRSVVSTAPNSPRVYVYISRNPSSASLFLCLQKPSTPPPTKIRDR